LIAVFLLPYFIAVFYRHFFFNIKIKEKNKEKIFNWLGYAGSVKLFDQLKFKKIEIHSVIFCIIYPGPTGSTRINFFFRYSIFISVNFFKKK
jgi:hypothetical protein